MILIGLEVGIDEFVLKYNGNIIIKFMTDKTLKTTTQIYFFLKIKIVIKSSKIAKYWTLRPLKDSKNIIYWDKKPKIVKKQMKIEEAIAICTNSTLIVSRSFIFLMTLKVSIWFELWGAMLK